MVLLQPREYTQQRSHPSWYRKFGRGGEDHDIGYVRFNER